MLITSLHYASICSYAFTYYYAQNYASIIREGLMQCCTGNHGHFLHIKLVELSSWAS